jgi:hypothetical protein
MYHPFSISQTIATAWAVLKKNYMTLAVYSIASLVIYEMVDFFNDFIFVDDNRFTQLGLILFQMVIQAYLALSFYKLILTLIDREFYEFSFRDTLPSFRMTFNFVLIALLYGVLIAIFLFIDLVIERSVGISVIVEIPELLIILYLLARSIFCVCFIVDDNSKPLESLKQSFEITKHNFLKTLSIFAIIIGVMILVLIPVIVLINIFGLDRPEYGFIFKLAFYCWFLLTFPFVQVLIMVTYRRLVYSSMDVDDDDVTETV